MDYRPIDKQVYEQELADWLPERIFDCHVHIGLMTHCNPISEERMKGDWAMEVGADQSWERWLDTCRTIFPRQNVDALVMGVPFKEMRLDENNDYVLAGIPDPRTKALFVTRPEWPAEKIAQAMDRGFIGFKPYPDLAPETGGEPSVFDFLPHSHLKLLDERKGVLMLHLPRAGRLPDPDNVRELLELSDRYPNVRVIVAHVGRSFCLPTAQRGLPHFRDRNLFFDIAANLNPDVFAYALETIGPGRILYGSDIPITLMHGVREHVGEKYINFTDGAYSWNTNRKSPEEEANYTLFIYEEIRAVIAAVQRVGLGKAEFGQITRGNAQRLLGV